MINALIAAVQVGNPKIEDYRERMVQEAIDSGSFDMINAPLAPLTCVLGLRYA